MKSIINCETEPVWCVQTVGDRLSLFPDIKTDAVLSVDEDVELVSDEVK